MIYLDNAATTFPKPEKVYEEMDFANRNLAVNAGRGSYSRAREVSELIHETKEELRKLINVDESADVVLSPSITIAINQIIGGLMLDSGAVVYVSPYEHNAVARPLNLLLKKKSIVIKEIPINPDTLEIDLEKMKYEFSRNHPSVIFCTHMSNVTGYVLPVCEIFTEGRKFGSINVLDTAQSLGLIDVNAQFMNADIIAFAGHKSLYGPFGIGGFINLTGIELLPCIAGGTGSDSLNLDMPLSGDGRYEVASSNIVAISGLNAALKELNQSKIEEHECALMTYLESKIKEIPNINICSQKSRHKCRGILSFTVQGLSSEDVGIILDEDFDIAVRTGYHCAPFIHKYLKSESSQGTVRVGLSQFSTINDIDALILALKDLV